MWKIWHLLELVLPPHNILKCWSHPHCNSWNWHCGAGILPLNTHMHTTNINICYVKQITIADLWLVAPSSWWPRLPCWGFQASSGACLSWGVSCTSSRVPSALHWCPGSVSYKHMPHTTTARQLARRHAWLCWFGCPHLCKNSNFRYYGTKPLSLLPDEIATVEHGCRTKLVHGQASRTTRFIAHTSYLLLQCGYNLNSLVQNFKFGFNFVCFKMHHAHVPQLLKCLIYVFHPYPATETTDNVFQLGWLVSHLSYTNNILPSPQKNYHSL